MSSFLDPTHEEQAAEILKRLLPGVYVTYSTELTRQWYEYERTSTVAANALCRAAGEYLRAPSGERFPFPGL